MPIPRRPTRPRPECCPSPGRGPFPGRWRRAAHRQGSPSERRPSSGRRFLEQGLCPWDLACELRKIEINPFAGEAPVPDREEDDDALAQLVPAGLDAEEWALHAAEDLRLFDDAVVSVDAVEQGQLHVRDPAPEAAVEFPNLVFATPAPPEWDDLVLAVFVQSGDQPLELATIFGARVLDPESI